MLCSLLKSFCCFVQRSFNDVHSWLMGFNALLLLVLPVPWPPHHRTWRR